MMKKHITEKKTVSLQDQFYRILRTSVPAVALSTGVYVDKIDASSPHLYDCCSRILGTVVTPEVLEDILSSVPSSKENYMTDVIFYTPLKYKEFNLMASKVQLDDQQTVKMTCIYTDDTDFNVDNLPTVTSESQCDAILRGDCCMYYEDCIYILKVLSREYDENKKPYYIQDVLVYLPEKVLNI